jgi:predicted lipoprotein with Yx(FWY)xxD motif
MGKIILIVAVVVAAMVAAGGFWHLNSRTKTPDSTAKTYVPEATGDANDISQHPILLIKIHPSLGPYLSGYNGMAVYTYAKDGKGTSNCSGSCATVWPPYTVASPSAINVSENVLGRVGAATRTDGTIQITYNDMPLYFYSGDKKPSEATGQGADGNWLVVQP